MKSEKSISQRNKKGSYIVEASVILPVFLLAVIMLISIIPVIATCEGITYAAGEEMRRVMAEAAFVKAPASLPVSAAARAKSENHNLTSLRTRGYRYLYSDAGIDDLITYKFRGNFSMRNPLGLYSKIRFDGTITGRAYTGSIHDDEPAGKDELVQDDAYIPVYVFPNWGKCYHGRKCTFVKANCQQVYLSQDIRRRFHACPLCGAGKAGIGSPVFCFFESGEAYHRAGCHSVDRYYIEMNKKDAISKGYGACSKCGGE